MKQDRDRDADQDDANLVASVLAGEREAFAMLLQRYWSSVLHLCTTLLGNTFEAQDIAQEAALQAFLGLSRLREPAHFSAWFHAIAANLARMALRRRRELSLRTLSDEDMTPFWIDSPAFPTREVTWDEQPMVAIRLPDQRETAWLLVPPLIWEKITRQLQGLREPRQKKERAPGVATPIPDVLPLQMQQQAEEHLARLVEMPEVRTAFLLNSHGRVSAWKGPDAQEALQRYSDSRNDLSGPTSLTNEHELRRQLGHQPQNISAVPYIEKKAIRQEQREEISARRIDAGRMVYSSGDGWRLVVFADRDMKEERRQHIHQAWRELRDILTQRASD